VADSFAKVEQAVVHNVKWSGVFEINFRKWREILLICVEMEMVL